MAETTLVEARSLVAGQVLVGDAGGESRVLGVHPGLSSGLMGVHCEHGLLLTEPAKQMRVLADVDEGTTEAEVRRLSAEVVGRLGRARAEMAFDGLVHDLASSVAAEVNNGGVESQVAYLVEKLGAAEAARSVATVEEE
jgi:hypothetical protein